LSGFKIRACDSGGLVSFFEFSLAAWESGPDLHLHAASDESFYVLSGVLEMQVGEQQHLLGAGWFAWVPRGMAHTFANAGPDAARALTIATPGGIEDFFVEQSRYLASSAGHPDRAVFAEIRERQAEPCSAHRYAPGELHPSDPRPVARTQLDVEGGPSAGRAVRRCWYRVA
jgi:hypothetical protein